MPGRASDEVPKIPTFADEQQAAAWFATHDTASYMEWKEDVQEPIPVAHADDKAKEVPARLFVILARKASKGVILRRGLSKWVELILWHTRSDTFDHGQWFHGRIYERACDLSPDGSMFLYFGSKYHLQKWAPSTQNYDPSILYEWTAISKPPYFTALAMWPHTPLESFGGVFLDNRKVVLRGSSERPIKGRLPSSFKV